MTKLTTSSQRPSGFLPEWLAQSVTVSIGLLLTVSASAFWLDLWGFLYVLFILGALALATISLDWRCRRWWGR